MSGVPNEFKPTPLYGAVVVQPFLMLSRANFLGVSIKTRRVKHNHR